VAVPFGADEAGKGPVIGSMFAAAVAGPAAAIPDDVDDSKRLSDARRERLARAIRDDDRLRTNVAEVSVERIDDPATDMNGLTVAAQAEALAGVVADGDRGVVDAGDTDAERFGDRLTARLSAAVEVTAEHGADGSDPHVAAASVLAKQARETHVAALRERYGDLGSGYPSDPTTRAFLAEYVGRTGELPDCARASWGTAEDVLAAAEQSTLERF
jgi:ribonuclease HII